MATVRLPVDTIRGALDDLAKKIQTALRSLPPGGGEEITLEIPEPFFHIVEFGPHKAVVCLTPPPFEECSDFGILLGLLKGRSFSGKKNPPKRK